MRTKVAAIIIVGFIAVITFHFIAFAANDTPHNASNNMSCGSCHGGTLLDSPFWGGGWTFDQLCLSCHTNTWGGPYSEISAPRVITHSSQTTSTKYGTWTRECRNCHNPHYQRQKVYKNTDASNLYLATGKIQSCEYIGKDATNKDISTFTYSTIAYKSGWYATRLPKKTEDYRGAILFPNVGKLGYNYPITAVNPGANTITVNGNLTTECSNNYFNSTTFAVIYGQYIKDILDISPDGSGNNKTVKLFDQVGPKSFADGYITYDGICEVCHTKTDHYRNADYAGSAPDQHHLNIGGADATNCISCHSHTEGFKPSCNICHGYPPPPLVSIPKATGSAAAGAHVFHVTTKSYQCPICHYNSVGSGTFHNDNKITLGFVSLLGSYTGGSYNGQTSLINNYDYESSDPGTTVSKTGLKKCSNLYCHGGTMAPDGGTATAIWDNPASAACGTCHGATVGAPPTRGSHTKHAGERQLACTVCHSSYIHVSGSVDWAYDTATYAWLSGALYKGAATGSATPVPSAGYGQCSNLYCHSIAQTSTGGPLTGALGEYSTPTWGETPWNHSSSAVCNKCHAIRPLSGSHPKHAGNASGQYDKHCGFCHYNFLCTSCHPHGGDYIVESLLHVNHEIDVSSLYWGGTYNGTKTPGDGFSTCSDAYCHSNGTSKWTGGTPSGTTTPQWGSSGPLGCNGCHGNTTYTDYRKGTPLYASYPSGTKPNAHQLHTDARTAPLNEPQCKHCHSIVTATNTAIDGTSPRSHANNIYNVTGGSQYYNGDNVGGGYGTNVSLSYSYSGTPNTSTCSNVSCHPTGLAGSKAASITKWSNGYSCTDCHKINMDNTSGYHHVMDSNAMADRTYPTSAPSSSAIDSNRKCTMCHVDHNIFSPMLNTNAFLTQPRAMNLRTAIGTTPTSTTGYINSDYVSGGGICISCHNTARSKNTTAQADDGTTETVVVTDARYSTSAHQYSVSSTMSNGGSTYNANCSKCHNAKNGETTTFQSSTNKFGVHDKAVRRLYASLGTTLTDGNDEQFCYRCHSKADDDIGGTKKTVDANDWYGAVTNMTDASTKIYQVFQRTYTAPPSQTTTLYFRNSADDSPGEPMPNAYLLSSGTYAGDTTFRTRLMTPDQGSNQESFTQNVTTTGTRYYRITQFVSPPVATAFSWNSGRNFTIYIRNQESSSGINAYVRYSLYKWNAADTQGTNFRTVATYSNEISTTAGNRTISFTNNNSISFDVDDKIVLEIEFYTNSASSTGTVTHWWGGSEQARLQMPTPSSGTISFDYGSGSSTFTPGHNIASYEGLHSPSPTDDDTRFTTNRHVECADCHNPHTTKQGVHTPANQWYPETPSSTTNNVSNAIIGVTGVEPLTWPVYSTTTNTLYFRDTNAPSEPAPDASASPDTFAGGTWQRRKMLATQGSTDEVQTISPNISGTSYWYATSFVSPPVASATDISAGNWTVYMNARESSGNTNAGERVTIYVWTASDVKGSVVVAPTSAAGELGTSYADQSIILSGSAVSLSVGDKIVVEYEVETQSWSSGTVDYRWGGTSGGNSRVIMPTDVTFGTSVPTFTLLPEATKEYQICFKCHSYYGLQDADGITDYTTPSGAIMTDQAMEFNPKNYSLHPVTVGLSDTGVRGTGSDAPYDPLSLTADQMSSPWATNVGEQTMYCSDCHGTNDENAGDPKGPHASSYKYMLKGPNKYWPTKSDGTTLWELNDITSTGPADLFCRNCHIIRDSSGWKNNVHSVSMGMGGGHQNMTCVECHVAVPHGSKRSRFIGYGVNATNPDPSPYNYNGNSLKVTGFRKADTPTTYVGKGMGDKNCATAGISGCHDSSISNPDP
jgi:predicted CxxxxCH...CXXCH cytochrome family protein